MMKSLPLILLLTLGPAPSQVETRVLNAIQEMLRQGTAVSFSQLQNDPHFGKEEKEFIGRLFEILFRIPAFVESELERTGQPPKRAQIGERFGVGVPSIELLLTVMEIDRRVPKMFDRDQAGEITRVHRPRVAAFLQRHGNPVRVTGWEGQPSPDFDLLTLEGKRLSSESLRGSNAPPLFLVHRLPALLPDFTHPGIAPPAVRKRPTPSGGPERRPDPGVDGERPGKDRIPEKSTESPFPMST